MFHKPNREMLDNYLDSVPGTSALPKTVESSRVLKIQKIK